MSQGRTWNHHLLFAALVCVACNNISTKTPVEESDDIVVKDLDGDGYEAGEDCDDSNAAIRVCHRFNGL